MHFSAISNHILLNCNLDLKNWKKQKRQGKFNWLGRRKVISSTVHVLIQVKGLENEVKVYVCSTTKFNKVNVNESKSYSKVFTLFKNFLIFYNARNSFTCKMGISSSEFLIFWLVAQWLTFELFVLRCRH